MSHKTTFGRLAVGEKFSSLDGGNLDYYTKKDATTCVHSIEYPMTHDDPVWVRTLRFRHLKPGEKFHHLSHPQYPYTKVRDHKPGKTLDVGVTKDDSGLMYTTQPDAAVVRIPAATEPAADTVPFGDIPALTWFKVGGERSLKLPQEARAEAVDAYRWNAMREDGMLRWYASYRPVAPEKPDESDEPDTPLELFRIPIGHDFRDDGLDFTRLPEGTTLGDKLYNAVCGDTGALAYFDTTKKVIPL